MVYVVIACHFRTQKELCATTIARLQIALNVAKEGDHVLVTGDVPYTPNGPTLGKLMQDWLVANGFPTEAVSVLHGGVGTFSEARTVCEILKGEEEIAIVSSPWYFFQGKPIWRRRRQENDINVSFISIPNTGGWRTVLTYAVIGIIVRTAILIGLERVLEDRLTMSQEKRREGFVFDGCK